MTTCVPPIVFTAGGDGEAATPPPWTYFYLATTVSK